MISPALAFRRFAVACLLGCGLGLLYGLLRPLRPKRTHLADLLFSVAAFWAWLYHSFAVCDTDIRMGTTAGLFLGCIGWELTFGKFLKPVYVKFWQLIRLFFRPLEKQADKLPKNGVQ